MNGTRVFLVLVCLLLSCVILFFPYKNTIQSQSTSLRRIFCSQQQASFEGMATSSEEPFLIPNDEILTSMSEIELIRMYWRYIHTIQILCRNQVRLGSLKDGGKEMCVDRSFKPTSPCIVYSFGSNFQFDFDVAAHNYLGCQVYTFDPTLDFSVKRAKKIPTELKFIEVGLDNRDYKTSKNWQMKTLKSIIKDNNHQNDTIDILKIDIDGYEWTALPNIIETGVHRQIKQLLIEVHFGHSWSKPKNPYWGNVPPAGQLRALRILYEAGFRIFMRDPVLAHLLDVDAPPQKQISPQMEISLVNTAYKDS